MHRFRTGLILLAASACTSALGGRAAAQPGGDLRRARLQMVSEFIEQEGIRNPRVLEAMRTVPRHDFVSRSLRAQAYWDGALPIGHKQTISPPFIVAYMTETIDPQPADRVLEIGTGSGYQAAVLGELVKEVYTIEIVEPLGRTAARRLDQLGYDNVHCLVGDGYKGWPEHAPFDKIIVTCSPESVPQPLVDQLKEGGKLLVPLGERYQQVFYLFEKQDGELIRQKLIPTLFVPMTGISEEQREVKPDPANPQIINGGFELDDNHDGRADNWHYQRQTELAAGAAPQGRQCLCFDNRDPGRLSQILQGMALDGRLIESLRIRVSVRPENVAPGPERFEQPGLMFLFFDDQRRNIDTTVLGPWTGTSDWDRKSVEIRVPPQAREAVLRIGLNGGTGRLCIDDVELVSQKR